jgi:serine/threonine-protein kinase
MALSPGRRFGPYKIVGEIGAGGMGVVYRATDTTLDRDVAIKVLPASMTSDADRIARFDREAKTLASLNHPNIAQVYGLEKTGDVTALVMELVEGPTLEDRIRHGALPVDQAMDIAMQIAAGLEGAHGRHIVHRDLKPANIKLRPDGTVKILDFGIAKALEPEALTSEPESAMMTTPATQVGVILGTAAYMSPEQAKGKPVDRRTDIWAFGCVLYEMLTGQPAFGGEDVATTMARVIANEPDLDALPAAASPAVRQTIKLCLTKELKRRVRDVGDVRLALEGAFETAAFGPTSRTEVPRTWRRALPPVAAALAAVLVTSVTVRSAMRPTPPTVTRFVHELAEGQILRTPARGLLAVSPDGQRFVYDTEDGLVLRSLDSLETRVIPGTEDFLHTVTFSPDGQSVAYFDYEGQLRRIGIGGGVPVVICGVCSGNGVSWEADGTIYFAQQEGIWRVSANGGEPDLVIEADPGTRFYGVDLLPDGDTLLFSVLSTDREEGSIVWDEGQIVVQSLSTGEGTVIVNGGTAARYLPTGHVVYALGDALFTVAFDADALTVSGGAVQIVQEVTRAYNDASPVAHYDVAENGTLVYLTGSAVDTRTPVWVNRQGRDEPIGVPPGNWVSPRISPDYTKLALNDRGGEDDIWVFDLNRLVFTTRLTSDPGPDRFPVWFPDGDRIAYSSSRSDVILWRAADGAGPAERLGLAPDVGFPTAFLFDGSQLFVFGGTTSETEDLSVVAVPGGEVTTLTETPFREVMAEPSPEGQWIAYVSDETGREEIYVRSYPNVEAQREPVSTGGGTQPLWARDGQTLYYRNGDAIMAVAVSTETEPERTITVGQPEIVIEGPYANPQGGRTYDIGPDGRFLMLKDAEDESGEARIVVVENWFSELNLLVPRD